MPEQYSVYVAVKNELEHFYESKGIVAKTYEDLAELLKDRSSKGAVKVSNWCEQHDCSRLIEFRGEEKKSLGDVYVWDVNIEGLDKDWEIHVYK